MRILKLLWKKILDILSHQAWNFGSCFFTALALLFTIVGVGGFFAFFRRMQDFVLWLSTPVLLPLYAFIALTIICFAIIMAESFRILKEKKFRLEQERSTLPKNTNQENLLQIHGVFWEGINNQWGGAKVFGPYCPVHLLELKVSLDENEQKFHFRCPGVSRETRHSYDGPTADALILRDSPRPVRYRDAEDFILYDVAKRIEAIWRREGRL